MEVRAKTESKPSTWWCGVRPVLAVLGLILLLTLFPYTFHFSSGSLDQGSLPSLEPIGPDAGFSLPDFVRNGFLFLPLGIVLAWAPGGRRHPRRGILLAGISCLLISAVIEFLQTGLPSRTPAVADVVANTLGGVGGGALVAWRPQLVDTWWAWSRRLLRPFGSRPALGTLLIIHLALVAWVAADAVSRSSLANWSSDYPLLLGNEATGDRPWHGELGPVTLTVAGHEVLAIRDGQSPSQLLTGSCAVPLSWQGEAPVVPAGGATLSLAPDAWLRSTVPATALAETIRADDGFDLRLTVTPADTLQRGPARIISLSQDPAHRDLTIGQEGGGLVVRLRTPFSGQNGTHPALVVNQCFAPGRTVHLAISYDGRRLVVRDAHERVLGRLELRDGAAVCHGPIRFNYEDQVGYRIACYGLAGLPTLLLMGLWWRRGG